MLLEENLRKEIQKKWKREKGGASRPRPRFWPTGRSRLGPPALSPPPFPALAPASARGRPRRDAVARRQDLAAAWRACGSEDASWSATRSARSRSPPPPLPFAPLSSLSLALSPSLRARRAPPSPLEPELRLGCSSPVRAPFFDLFFPELRPRSAVAEHSSERSVRHGEPRSPSFSSPARAPPPHA